MDAKRLEEIRERAEKATPGPWELFPERYKINDPNPVTVGPIRNGDFELVAEIRYPEHFDHICDAAFITAARQDVPDLLDEVERLRKAGKDLLDVITAFGLDGGWGNETVARSRAALEEKP